MKLNYYGYSIQKFSNSKRYLVDMRDFLHSFCSYDNVEYKNTFIHNGEHVYLLPVFGKVFLFLMTRSNEVIKKIQEDDLSVGAIYDLLEKGEMIGVASYVYVDKSHFGLASTAMAPRVNAFVDFVNNIFNSVGISRFVFVSHPMMTQATKKEALNMSFIGRSTIQVDKENSVFKDFINQVNGTTEEFVDVDSIEITIKPKVKKNIDAAVKKVIKAVPDDGLEKMLIRAKEDIHGPLIDLYLAGKGTVSDTIKSRDERVICTEILAKIKSNEVLKAKVADHEGDDQFKKAKLKVISKWSNPDFWADNLPNI